MSSLADRYRKFYAGVVYDAMAFDVGVSEPFVVSRSIKLMSGMTPRLTTIAGGIQSRLAIGSPLVGPAFTCLGERVIDGGNDIFRVKMLGHCESGEVFVMDTGGDATVAHFGDISAQLLRQAGIVGAVIDGYTRDLARIRDTAFPVFARGAQPQDAYGRWALIRHSCPIVLRADEGGVTVCPGDYVFGDTDGVLVIPAGQAEAVCEAAEKRAERERQIVDELRTKDPVEVYWRRGRW